jgi:hypothetical protein
MCTQDLALHKKASTETLWPLGDTHSTYLKLHISNYKLEARWANMRISDEVLKKQNKKSGSHTISSKSLLTALFMALLRRYRPHGSATAPTPHHSCKSNKRRRNDGASTNREIEYPHMCASHFNELETLL